MNCFSWITFFSELACYSPPNILIYFWRLRKSYSAKAPTLESSGWLYNCCFQWFSRWPFEAELPWKGRLCVTMNLWLTSGFGIILCIRRTNRRNITFFSLRSRGKHSHWPARTSSFSRLSVLSTSNAFSSALIRAIILPFAEFSQLSNTPLLLANLLLFLLTNKRTHPVPAQGYSDALSRAVPPAELQCGKFKNF